MIFDFGYTGPVVCILVMLIVWLLVKYYRLVQQFRRNEERLKKFVDKLFQAGSCTKVNNIIYQDETFTDEESLPVVFNDGPGRKVEAALRNSQELLSLAAGLAHLGPWKYHPAERLFEFDDEFYVIYGTNVAREGSLMTPEKYVEKFVHPDDAGMVALEVQKMLETTECCYTAELEHRIIRHDGVVRTVLVRIAVMKDSAGKIQKSYGVNQDITECKATESALHNSRKMLSLAAELAHLGPWEYHPAKGVFEFSDEFYAIFGTDVAREGLFMTPDAFCREFVHPDDVWIFKAAEVEKNCEHRIICRDGQVRNVAVQGNVIKEADGKIIKWYGATQDVTAQKQAEAALDRQTEKIRRIAYTDTLTGLSNRAYLNERLAEEMEQARNGLSAGSVPLIDLDDLKTVNDTLGHTYGDAIIVEAGKRIKDEVNEQAFVGRIDGDEFVVILFGKRDRQCIAAIADGIIDALGRDTEVFGEIFNLSASIGVSIYPDDGDTAEEILKNADNAMYFCQKFR